MARISARFTHFWARNKVFKHFWMDSFSSINATAPGSTISATASIIDGIATGAASVNGQLLSATASLISGATAAGANASGVTLTIPVSLLEGAAAGQANASGDLLVVNAEIIEGSASGAASASGDTLIATAEIIAGMASGAANAAGEALAVQASLIPGAASGEVQQDGHADGALIEVSAVLIAGVASAPGAIEAPQPVMFEGPGVRHEKIKEVVNAVAFGEVIVARIVLDAGVASAKHEPALAIVAPAPRRASVDPEKHAPVLVSETPQAVIHVEAQGAIISAGLSLLAGGASVVMPLPIKRDRRGQDDRDFELLFAA